MQKEKINYSIRRSRRAKHMRISVAALGAVVVTVPQGVNLGLAEKFVKLRLPWIKRSLDYFKKFSKQFLPRRSRGDYVKFKFQAKQLAEDKVIFWNRIYNFSYRRISIKNQKSRWGSCSRKGNLNFNYRIVHLPEAVLDYLVIHELCHLQEFNHKANFWQLVAKGCPDYKLQRKQLRGYI